MRKWKIGFFKGLGLVSLIATELGSAVVDGKITIREGVNVFEKICNYLGIEFDKTGVEV